MNDDKDKLVKLLTSSKVPNAIPADAIVIIDGVRTPLTKAKRGGLKDYKADELLSVVLKVLSKSTMMLSILLCNTNVKNCTHIIKIEGHVILPFYSRSYYYASTSRPVL